MAASAAMALGGCETRDFGPLPTAEKDRALLCAQTGVIAIGMRAQFDTAAAKDRMLAKVTRLNAATGFETLFPQAATDVAGAIGGADTAANAVQSHWLTTLNACLKAYDIEEEPLPALPADPYRRAITCAAATALDATRGMALDPRATVANDPQGYYFIHKAAQIAGNGALDQAGTAATAAVRPVLDAGTGHLFAERCRADDAKAATAATVGLPADMLTAGVICTTTFASLKDRGIGVGMNASNLAHRYALAEKRVDQVMAAMTVDEPAVSAARRAEIAHVASVGNGDAVANACLKRFPPA
ncbi:hypothetical protein M9980_09935 [Sphingomonas donggukensis]|uniref:Lipoprotein n=1 Tax=Sphingomonas donggukensis TaxID=2949093 RepID=A0ABY4TUP4_9SPHN|nr:hypothetical protein [Sphingomonas donggukensis]URW74884.1 hypothetical protein M9980_09935 [Sphingomonas donggukensis]